MDFLLYIASKKEKEKGLCETDLCPEWATAVTGRPQSNGSDAACSANGLLSEPIKYLPTARALESRPTQPGPSTGPITPHYTG